MKDDMGGALAPAILLAIERTQGDLVHVLACLHRSENQGAIGEADELLARAIGRLDMMRMALAQRDDGPVLS